MESDWGRLGESYQSDDDYIQSYENYYHHEEEEEEDEKERESLEELLKIVGGEEDDDEEEDEPEQEEEKYNQQNQKKNKKKRINHSKERGGNYESKKKRKKKRSPKTGTEIFYETILSWDPLTILKEDRFALHLPRLVAQTSFHQTISHYCDSQKQLPIEEARISLVHGFKDPEDCFTARYSGNGSEFEQMREGLVPVVLEIRNNYDLVRPGWVFCLIPSEENPSSTRRKSQRSLSSQLFEDLSNENSYLMATLATGKFSYSTHHESISLWIQSSHLQFFLRRYAARGMGIVFPQSWKVYSIQNLITYQRMFVACHDTPNPPFMRALIGQKSSTHIIFDEIEDLTTPQLSANSEISAAQYPDCLSDLSSVMNSFQLRALSKITRAVMNTKLNLASPLSSSNFQVPLDHLHLVQGPPGCGKTHFLCQLLYALINSKIWKGIEPDHFDRLKNQHLTALVCAPSNKAISVVVEKYCSLLSPNSWMADPIVLIGVQEKLEACSSKSSSKTDPLKESEFGISYSSDWYQDSSIVRERIRIECVVLLNQGNEMQSQLPLGLIPHSLNQLFESITSPTIAADCLIYTYPQRYSALLIGFSTVYSCCVSENICQPHLLVHLTETKKALILAILNTITTEYYSLIEVIEQSTPSFWKLYLKHIHHIIISQLEILSTNLTNTLFHNDSHSLHELTAKMKQISDSFREFSETFVQYSQDFLVDLLNHSAVICSTLSSSGCYLLRNCRDNATQIDLLIVDEAGQCLESELLIPFYTNPSHLVLIGDPKQLPATILSFEAQQMKLGESPISRLMYDCNVPYDILSIQYRMHPDICQFPNRQFYQNQLVTSSIVHERQHFVDHLLSQPHHSHLKEIGLCENWPPWKLLQNYIWIDVNGKELSGGVHGKSKANHDEANVIVRVLNLFSREKISLTAHLGIITFYSAQVHEIKRTLATTPHHLNLSKQVKIMTVDGFQGSECDIIIVSFVRSNRQSNVGFLSDFQRLNVSLTRAKYLLILIGSIQTFESSDCLELKNLIHDARDRNRIITYEKLNEI